MASSIGKHDYSLTGPLNARSQAIGLANAECGPDARFPGTYEGMMKRSDGPATRDTILWIGLLALTGGLGAYLWGSWWCVPFFLVYGVLYQFRRGTAVGTNVVTVPRSKRSGRTRRSTKSPAS